MIHYYYYYSGKIIDQATVWGGAKERAMCGAQQLKNKHAKGVEQYYERRNVVIEEQVTLWRAMCWPTIQVGIYM